MLTCDSFQSGRYFGKQAQEIRRTRRVDVMVNPPYLQQYAVSTNLHSAQWSRSLGSLATQVSWSFVISLAIVLYFGVVIWH